MKTKPLRVHLHEQACEHSLGAFVWGLAASEKGNCRGHISAHLPKPSCEHLRDHFHGIARGSNFAAAKFEVTGEVSDDTQRLEAQRCKACQSC